MQVVCHSLVLCDKVVQKIGGGRRSEGGVGGGMGEVGGGMGGWGRGGAYCHMGSASVITFARRGTCRLCSGVCMGDKKGAPNIAVFQMPAS